MTTRKPDALTRAARRLVRKNEHIITAWAETASGPGWANAPVWVLVRENGTGNLRVDCLQPHEQSAEVLSLYGVCAAAHGALTAATRRLAREAK